MRKMMRFGDTVFDVRGIRSVEEHGDGLYVYTGGLSPHVVIKRGPSREEFSRWLRKTYPGVDEEPFAIKQNFFVDLIRWLVGYLWD